MSYLIKNKKYTFMIIFFICSFFFIGNAHALVYKDYYYDTAMSPTSFSGSINNGQSVWLDVNLNNTLTTTYDLIAFKFNKLNLSGSNYLTIDNPYFASASTKTLQCTHYSSNGSCDAYILNPQGGSYPQDLVGSLDFGDSTIYGIAWDTRNYGAVCYFDSTMSNYFFCPMKGLINIKSLSIIINQNGNQYFNYDIELDGLRNYYNYDSTDIVNALLGVNVNTQNTTSAIETQTQQQAQQNAYVQSSNISQAQSNTTQSITVLNDSLTQELSQFSDLTNLVIAPITMFMELNNNVCAPLTLQIPFVNQTAVLPCIKPIMTQYFGGMYSVFTTVIGAILCYWTFVKTVALIKDLVDADNDKIEVVDL